MSGEEVLSAILLVGMIFGAGFIAGIFLPNVALRLGIRRRYLGKATGQVIEYVLNDLDYTVKQGNEGDSKVELSARYYNRGEDKTEWFSVSLEVNGQTEIADALHRIYRARAVHISLRPFTRAKDAQTEEAPPLVAGAGANEPET